MGPPCSPVVGSPPANEGTVGLIPGPGGSHQPRGHRALKPQLEPEGPIVRAPQQEEPLRGEAEHRSQRAASARHDQRKPLQQGRPGTVKNKYKIVKYIFMLKKK